MYCFKLENCVLNLRSLSFVGGLFADQSTQFCVFQSDRECRLMALGSLLRSLKLFLIASQGAFVKFPMLKMSDEIIECYGYLRVIFGELLKLPSS